MHIKPPHKVSINRSRKQEWQIARREWSFVELHHCYCYDAFGVVHEVRGLANMSSFSHEFVVHMNM